VHAKMSAYWEMLLIKREHSSHTYAIFVRTSSPLDIRVWW
jgi:hypothetical protein